MILAGPKSPFYINIHAHNAGFSENVLAIENVFIQDLAPNTIFQKPVSIGLHPWHIENVDWKNELIKLKTLSSSENVLAIGEIGLDKLTNTSVDIQSEIFKKQVEISENTGKPVIIHCVKAFEEIIRLKKEIKPTMPWIIHGFNKNPELALQLANQGFYLSFGNDLLTDKPKLKEAFRQTPNERIFLETDESNALIKTIYGEACKIKSISPEGLREIIITNFKTCFK